MTKEESKRDVMSQILHLVAPGTPFREGLENVLRAKTGALIVVGFSEEVKELVDGGFNICCEFSPSYLYELAKMDGAIILSEDTRKILFANTQLNPDSTIASIETGIRHRTAERVAKQTGKLVVSISQRRNVITLYQGNLRYSLKDIGVILVKANQAIQTLERYKIELDQTLTNLGALEFEQLVTLHDVAHVLQRMEMVFRIKNEIKRYITELGSEGRLISMQLDEMVGKTGDEVRLLIKDYVRELNEDKVKEVMNYVTRAPGDELLDPGHTIRLLGYPYSADESAAPRGFRMMSKIPRLPSVIIHNLVEKFQNFPNVLSATIEDLDDVDGIGEVRARTIKEGLKRIQDQVFIDRHI